MFNYKWHTGGMQPCFACRKWSGHVFKGLVEVPNLPVHTNCECYIEALNDPKITEQLKQVGLELDAVRNSVLQALELISHYQLSSWFGSNVLDLIKKLSSDVQQFAGTIEIFWQNYNDMKKANTIGADKYFHSKANAEAAQLGSTGEAVANFIGQAREIIDFWKYLLRDRMTIEDIIKDMNNDLKANAYGRKAGRNNPNTPAEDLIDIYRPEGLDIKY